MRPPSGAGEPNIIGAAADCTGIYGQQHPRRPRQQDCNRKYGRQICSVHDSALSSFTNHLLEGGVDPTANVFIAADDADACSIIVNLIRCNIKLRSW